MWGMIYRRDCLGPNHPESTYNYIKRVLKVPPEDYNVFKSEIFKEKTFWDEYWEEE